MNRNERLCPNNVPKYIRCYDNEGKSIDRYTVVFTGRYRHKTGSFLYLAMNDQPFHPQGFGQHGESQQQIDVSKWGYPVRIGETNHLGKRINFEDLPADCKKLVLSDYKELWDLS